MLHGHLRLSRQCPPHAPKKKHAAPRHPRSPPHPPTPVEPEEVSLMPEWEGDAAGEVEAGTFNIEDGPCGSGGGGRVGGTKRETEGAAVTSSISYSHFDED
jgi:hypothetical protein